ncbi:outer membrane protein transport protein [Limimaricola pyoseonensis]|uniref:Long-chain fatty acid transport protein n=1 Tax=Limimaricola pyoseonensis TaxID=521013 RepID=A0A1G7AFF9_9RHOB|nr:outer membrane protein transport protein [Limimaricola pyoseonensis]SDE13500.1 Long-chain fatty acid transport protein [Limimaricola pyoseonensis]
MTLHHGAASAIALAAALAASQAAAVGLDRSNQDVTAIFEEGNVLELSLGRVWPDISGEDGEFALFPGSDAEYDDVGEDFLNASGSLKFDVNPDVSMALIVDQPFGADIMYSETPGSNLGGTSAELDSVAATVIGRYKINPNFSVHGGLRRETLEGSIRLEGLAYGGLSGYEVMLDENDAYGYVLGAAYERPEIALRVALTYNSSIEHDFDSTETLGGVPIGLLPVTASGGLDGIGETKVETPAAWNLDMQTGVAQDTLVFANIRYAEYSETLVSPEFFSLATGGQSLTNIEDNYSAQIGVGRRFNDMFSGQVAIGYEPEKDDLVSPLQPTNGSRWVSLGGAYKANEQVTISGGVRYTWLGDAFPETGTPDTARASFDDNTAVAYGMSISTRF